MKSVTSLVCVVLLCAAVPAEAVDCTINVYDAYNTAKSRAWTFECDPNGQTTGGFVTYPPPMSTIGCVFKTPPFLRSGTTQVGEGRLFIAPSGVSPASLKNSWKIKSFEMAGGQWENFSASSEVKIRFVTAGPKQGNKTYNYSISKLILTRGWGSCADAIEEAF